jgi:hypothetical protein
MVMRSAGDWLLRNGNRSPTPRLSAVHALPWRAHWRRHSRVSRIRCADCETTNGYVDLIDCEVELTGDLDDTQRQRVLHIAERCPVHQTLTSEVRITTSLS